MKINVTQEHINTGEAGNCKACPVALALLDAGIALAGLSVGQDEITWMRSVPTYRIDTPSRVAKFIEAFDEGAPVKPFSFILQEK